MSTDRNAHRWTVWGDEPDPIETSLAFEAACEYVDEFSRLGRDGLYAEQDVTGEIYE